MSSTRHIEQGYQAARERYAELDVDTELALRTLAGVPISIQCWQGDDVGGFENSGQALGGGLAVSGTYPGKARTADELRQDFEQALKVIPGRHRFNLHASYGEPAGKTPDRDALTADGFRRWIDWAKSLRIGLDFNQTYFAHAKVVNGFTLTSSDPGVRDFCIEHGILCGEFGVEIGKALGQACLTNEADALERMEERSFDALLVDFNLGSPDASDLLNAALEKRPETARFLTRWSRPKLLDRTKFFPNH